MTIQEQVEQFVSDIGGWMRSLREDHYEQHSPTDEETKAKINALISSVVEECCTKLLQLNPYDVVSENREFPQNDVFNGAIGMQLEGAKIIRRHFAWLEK